MDSQYQQLFKQLERIRGNRCRYYLGLTDNLDQVIAVDTEALGRAAREIGVTVKHVNAPPPEVVRSTRDLVLLLLSCMQRGVGGETSILHSEVCRFVEEHFSASPSLGGTGVRAAAVAEEAGIFPTVHLSSLDAAIAGILSNRSFHGIYKDRSFPAHSATLDPAARRTQPHPHYIFQFYEGQKVTLADGEVVAARHNRLILPRDRATSRLPLHTRFFQAFHQDAGPAVILVSGFNATDSRRRVRARVRKTVRELKQGQDRGKLIVQEMAGYRRTDLFRHVLARLGPYTSYTSMNAEELELAANQTQGEARFRSEHERIVEKAARVCRRYRLGNLIVHSDELAFCLTETPVAQAEIRTALLAGNLVGATTAMSGSYHSLEERLSAGLELTENEHGAELCGSVDGTEFEGRTVIAVPARRISGKAETLGLGDAFIGAVALFLGVVPLLRDAAPKKSDREAEEMRGL